MLIYLYLTGNVIIGFSDSGSIDEPCVPKNELPEGFLNNFEYGKWLYENGAIVENPDYVPPEPPGPSLEEQVEALKEQNQMLTDCILEMSEIVYGGGDT